MIAAHAAAGGGIFKALQGQARSAVRRHAGLKAYSLPGPVTDAPDEIRPTLDNRNADYLREPPLQFSTARMCATRRTWPPEAPGAT